MTQPLKTQIHASCIELAGTGVLLRGPSGSGKSDLALRLIDAGAKLVADDRTDLWTEKGRLLARARATVAGLIGVRGLGIVKSPHGGHIRLALWVKRGRAAARLPEPQFYR